MRTDRIFPIIGLLAAFTVSCPPTSAQQDQSQSGDSVAEAARKAREQKKSAPKPKHIVTEDEIAPRVPEPRPQSATVSAASVPAADSAAPAADVTSGPAATGAEKNDPPNSEAYWRKRFAAQRTRIADAQVELDVLQRETEKASVQYYSDPQKALQEQYSRKEVNDKTEKVEAKKKEIAALKQQLSDLEDELKRAGGDPGWAR